MLMLPLIFWICLNNFINIWLPKKIQMDLERKKEQIIYKRALFLYLLLFGFLIFFFNKIKFLSISISAVMLLAQILFIIIIISINPYRQSLRIHTVTLLINHGVYTIFLVVLNIINFVEKVDEIIILGMGYLIMVSCFVVMVLSIIRIYYQYRYG